MALPEPVRGHIIGFLWPHHALTSCIWRYSPVYAVQVHHFRSLGCLLPVFVFVVSLAVEEGRPTYSGNLAHAPDKITHHYTTVRDPDRSPRGVLVRNLTAAAAPWK